MLVNKGRAEEAMRRFGLDALVAASPVNITYLSDYRCWLDPLFKEYMSAPGGSSERGQSYALLPLEGEPALVVSALFAVNAADAWVRDLRPYGDPGLDDGLAPGHDSGGGTPGPLGGDDRRFYDLLHPPARHGSPAEALAALLRDRGLDAGTIGVDIEGWPAREKARVEGLLPRARLKNCTNLFRWIRMVKSAEEIARLRRSAEINERAAMDSLALASPGRPMADLIRSLPCARRRVGRRFRPLRLHPARPRHRHGGRLRSRRRGRALHRLRLHLPGRISPTPG